MSATSTVHRPRPACSPSRTSVPPDGDRSLAATHRRHENASTDAHPVGVTALGTSVVASDLIGLRHGGHSGGCASHLTRGPQRGSRLIREAVRL